MIKRVIIDTDAGVDDALALMLAFRSPEIAIETITTVSGNAHVDICTRNVLLLMQELGVEPQPPVVRGEQQPLNAPLVTAPEVHGHNGLGNVTDLLDEAGIRKYSEPPPLDSDESGATLIARLTRENPDVLEIITLGPLTNIARAMELDRDAMGHIKGITIMGGAFREYGNTSLVAEFNFFVDPEAAAKVLELEVPKVIVPLDVTERAILPRSRLTSMIHDKSTNLLELAHDIAMFYIAYHQEHCNVDGCYLHDPLTVAAAIDPDIIETLPTYVQVETKGQLTRGMAVAELRLGYLPKETNARVAVCANYSKFLDLFLQRIAR